MAYNTLNKLRFYKKVIDIVNKNYISGITTYAGVYREFVNPIYPMSYDRFMDIVSFHHIDTKIKEEEERLNQLNLFPTIQPQ